MTSPKHRRIIGLSTKMYFSLQKTKDYTDSLIEALQNIPLQDRATVDIFLVPDYIAITSVGEKIAVAGSSLLLGAQDAHWEVAGAFTGEVSPSVLREAGVRIVEVGHTERHRFFGEDDDMTARKAAAVASNGMTPLVCIGERTKGSLDVVLDQCRAQIDAVMAAVPNESEVVLAYEPVWAIGANEPAAEDHILGVVHGIKRLESVRNRQGATRVVYGGSAGLGLFQRLKDEVDGLFVGRFGHDPIKFSQMVEEVIKA